MTYTDPALFSIVNVVSGVDIRLCQTCVQYEPIGSQDRIYGPLGAARLNEDDYQSTAGYLSAVRARHRCKGCGVVAVQID